MLVKMQERRQRQSQLAEPMANRNRLWAIFLLFTLSFAGVDGFAAGVRIGGEKYYRHGVANPSSGASPAEIGAKLHPENSVPKDVLQILNGEKPPLSLDKLGRDANGRFQRIELYNPTPQERSKQLYQKVAKALRASPLDFWTRDSTGRFIQPAIFDPSNLSLQRDRHYQAATDVVATASSLATASGRPVLTPAALKQKLVQLDKDWIVADSVALSAGLTGAKLNDIHTLTIRSGASTAEINVNLKDGEGRPENFSGRVTVDLDAVVKAITDKGY